MDNTYIDDFSSGNEYDSSSQDDRLSKRSDDRSLSSLNFNDTKNLSASKFNLEDLNGEIENKSDRNSNISSRDSFSSSTTNLSRPASLNNLEEEFKPKFFDSLSLNVYQLLFSIRDSVVKIYHLKSKFQENVLNMKSSKKQINDLLRENENLADEMINEAAGLISIIQVVYGKTHWKLAWSHINIAQIYLEYKNLPKQAKHHCEVGWRIYFEDLRDEIRFKLTNHDQVDEYYNENSNKHNMLINYIYGRSCTILKDNKEGEAALEKAKEYFDSWKTELKEKKSSKSFLLSKDLKAWRLKIFLALAKQYAINGSYANAIVFYDKLLDLICRKRQTNKTLNILLRTDQELLNEIYKDKSKLELKRGNFDKAIDLIKDAIKICEENGDKEYVLDFKIDMAFIFTNFDDMNSSSKAEEIYKEVLDEYDKIFDNKVNEQSIKVKENLAKFYLKQDKYNEANNLLNSLLKDQIEFYGDFNLKLNSTYKFLCAVYLKKNDMPQAAFYLQKSLELEELCFGLKSNKTLETKETLENLKKNPNVQQKLKCSKDESKPTFHAGKAIDYIKSDKSLYSNIMSVKESHNAETNISNKLNKTKYDDDDTAHNTSYNKKINPLK